MAEGSKEGASNNVDWFARIFSIISLVVAGLAILIPYKQQNDNNQESISLSAGISHKESTIVLGNKNFRKDEKLISVPWKITVSNRGYTTVSLIDYHISVANAEEMGVIYYSGIEGGIFDLDNNKVRLPIKLEAGVSQDFLINIGTIIPDSVYQILNTSFPTDSILYEDALRELGRRGIDLNGKKYKYEENGDSYVMVFSPDHYKNTPKFKIEATTGRGNKFFTTASFSDI